MSLWFFQDLTSYVYNTTVLMSVQLADAKPTQCFNAHAIMIYILVRSAATNPVHYTVHESACCSFLSSCVCHGNFKQREEKNRSNFYPLCAVLHTARTVH